MPSQPRRSYQGDSNVIKKPKKNTRVQNHCTSLDTLLTPVMTLGLDRRGNPRASTLGPEKLFAYNFEKVQDRRGQTMFPCLCACVSVCLSVCVSLASHSSANIKVITIKLGMVTASDMVMHHMFIILTLIFIQGHTYLNH